MHKSEIACQELDLNELEVVNLTELGKCIQSFCEEYLHLIYDIKRFGWLDGGCFALASGLELIFNKHAPGLELSFVCVGRTHIPIDHVVVNCHHPVCGDIYIDADGVATADEINNKMIFMESTGTSGIKDLDLSVKEPFPISDFSNENIPQSVYLASLDHEIGELIKNEFESI